MRGRLLRVGLGLSLLLGGASWGQSLAHKGWTGNGIAVAPWWQGAVFYELDHQILTEEPEELATGLDELRGLGVDALVLPAGEADEAFDRVVREATARRMRVVVDLAPGQPESETVSRARAWLNRGVAGLRLAQDAAGDAAEQSRRVSAIERVVESFAGQRVLLWDGPATQAVGTPRHRRGPRATERPQSVAGVLIDHGLLEWPDLDAKGLRRMLALQGADGGRARVLDGNDLRAALLRTGGEGPTARRVAAAMLLGGEAPMLYPGEQGSGQLAKWYQSLGEIRHNSAAVRGGRLELMDVGNGEVVAWVWRGRAGGVVSPPVLVLVNFSDRPVRLALRGELLRAGIAAGNGNLRTLAATDEQKETTSLDSLGIEAGGVYVGELKGVAGLEAAPEPVKRRR